MEPRNPPASKVAASNFARRLGTIAVVSLVAGPIVLGLGWPTLAGVFFGLAIATGLLAVAIRGMGRQAATINLARDALSRGDAAEAERLLDSIRPTRTHLTRAVALQRAMLAVHRGDMRRAVEQATTVLKRDLLSTTMGRIQRASAHAYRAFAHASLGEATEAVADIARAEADAVVPLTLARAALARAVLLARTGDRAALRQHLVARSALMLDQLLPRERTLVRALRSFAWAAGNAVYREPAARDERASEAAPGALGEWVEAIAPGAAPYVASGGTFATTPMSALPPSTRASSKRAAGGSLRLWGVLVVFFIVTWRVLSSSPDAADGPASEPLPGWLAALPLVMLAALVPITWRNRRAERALEEALRSMAEGNEQEATERFARLTKSVATVAGAAHLMLGSLALRNGVWERALACADAGLERVRAHPGARLVSRASLLPMLVTLRGVALAAMGLEAEAETERAVLAREYPAFAGGTAAQLRIRLHEALARRDLRAAAEIARSRGPELPMPLEDDLIAELVIAGEAGVTDGERARIGGELADDPRLRAYVDAVAPGLRERVLTVPVKADAS